MKVPEGPARRIEWLVFFLISLGFSQTQLNHGVLYPEQYSIRNPGDPAQSTGALAKFADVSTFKKITPDFLVNSGCGDHGSDQSHINIARDDNGNYLCVWLEERTGLREIDAQLYTLSDEKSGGLIVVSDKYNDWNSQPAIVYNPVSGEYLISWAESYSIKLQRISQQGNKIGTNITISQSSRTNTNNPTAVVSPSGSVLITWMADSPAIGYTKTFYRMFSQDLTPLGNERDLIQTPGQTVSSVGWDSRAAADTSGRFVITWSTRKNNRSQIIVQVVDSDGEPEGPNLEVSDSTDNSNNVFPTIASTDDGYYLVLWNSWQHVTGRIFHPDSGLVTPPFVVNEETTSWYSYTVNSDRDSKFYILFTEPGLTGQIISKQGEFLGPNISLSVSGPVSYPVYPKLSRVRNGNMYAGYYGYHDSDLDILAQKYDQDFNPLSVPFKVAADSCSSWQLDPRVKYNQSGQSIIIWTDKRYGHRDLFGRIYDTDSHPLTSEFLINDTTGNNYSAFLDILPDGEGNFILLFLAGEYSHKYLTIQKISPAGTMIGDRTTVIDYHNSDPWGTIALNDSGEILIAWMRDDRYSSGYLQKFDPELHSLSPITEFIKGYSPAYKKLLSISVNSAFDLFAVWLDYNPGTGEAGRILKGQWFNQTGSATSPVRHIDSLNQHYDYSGAVCQVNNDSSLICVWKDRHQYGYRSQITFWRSYKNCSEEIYRDTYSLPDNYVTPRIVKYDHRKTMVAWNAGKNVYALFLNDNNRKKSMVNLHTFTPYYAWRQPFHSYDVSIFEDQLLIGYESVPVPDKGFDIYANVQRMEGFDFDSVACYAEDQGRAFAKETFFEIVYPPFPNPAHNQITIWYELRYKSKVRISVYDLRGQEIKKINYGYRSAGLYYETINTGSLATGLYFIHFQGRGTITMKFLVLH